MADETISTRIVANADFSALIADVHKVTASLSKLQEQLANSNKMLANNIAVMNRNFADTIRSTGQYSTHFVSLTSDVEKFGKNLDGGRLKLKDYFGTFQQHVRTSGGLIRELARQQVAMQNAILQPLGRNAQGLQQFNVHIPRGLDEIKNKTSLARQELAIMNRVIQDGAVQLINWGKNTQWAGRQLTVGLTLPLAAFGKASADAFRQADQELTRLTKVYGDIAGATSAELGKVRQDVIATSKELSQAYGTNFNETISLAADIAATGKQGQELLASVKETSRLAVLGEVDRQEAMKATLAIQTAFQQNTDELAQSINFLNAVENQTSTSLADLVEAIPKAGPVVKQLGGDIEDLALYMTAMREGGINASEGANALKSGLAALINPTKQTVGVMSDFGIDILSMVKKNAGDTTSLLFDLQGALNNLDPLQKAQAIEQLFGKFQFARISALLNNLGRQGSQTLNVLDLMKASASELETVAGRELAAVTESASGKYKRAIESLRADLAGLGDQFLTIGTAMINIVDKALKFFDKLPQPIKQAVTFLGALTAMAGPLIMITGVLANFFGYILKGVMHMKAFFKGGEGWKYLTPEMMAAEKAGKLVEQTFYSDAKAASVLQLALRNLIDEFSILEAKAKSGVMAVNPTITTLAGNAVMGAGAREVIPGHPLVGDYGTRASTHMVPRAGLSAEQRMQQTIFGLVPGSIPVNRKIGDAPQIYMNEPLPPVPGLTQVGGVSTGVVAGEAARWHAMMATLAMQSKAEIETLKKQIATTGVVSKDFMNQFDDILPIVSGITDNAATQSSLIVAELRAGKITVEQARAQIIALNLEIERMIGSAVGTQAAAMGRTLNPTMVPTLDQPVVDPTGKSNMRELFKKSKTRDLIDKVSRSLGVRTSGAGYNIETTRPKRMNMGGVVYKATAGQVNAHPGSPRGTDTVPAWLTEGEYVIRASQVTPETLPILEAINNGGKAEHLSAQMLWQTTRLNQGLEGRSAPGEELMPITGRNVAREYRGLRRAGLPPVALLYDAGIRLGYSPQKLKLHLNNYEKALTQAVASRGNRVLSKTELEKIQENLLRRHADQLWRVDPTTGKKINFFSETELMGSRRVGGRGGSSFIGNIIRPLLGTSSGFKDRQNEAHLLRAQELLDNPMHTTTSGQTIKQMFGVERGHLGSRLWGTASQIASRMSMLKRGIRFPRRMNSGGMVYMNSGGMVPGAQYMQNGGKLRSALSAGFQEGRSGAPRQPSSGMMSGMAGMGLMMGGQMMGGETGQAMQTVGMLVSFMPMISSLGRMLKNVMSLTTVVTKFGTIAGRVFTGVRVALAAINPVGALVTVTLTGLIALFLKMRKDAAENKRNQEAMFGTTEKGAKELGITYTNLADKMKAVREEQKLMADKAKAQFESYTSAGVSGLTLTIKQLKELKERVKSDMPETLAVLNDIDSTQVNQWASNLKAQMVSAGKSTEEATNLIYALIESSNKAGRGVSTITDKAFMAIADKGAAADYIIKNLSNNIDDLANIDPSAFATNVDTAITSLDNAVRSLVGTKDASGEMLDEAEALAIQFEKMAAAGVKNKKLGEETLATLKSERPELAGILNSSDTIGGMYAKWRLYLQGVNLDLKNISSAQAEAIAAFTAALDSAGANALAEGGTVAGLEEARAALKKLNGEYEKANKLSKTENIDSKGLSKDRIRAIQDEIKAIRKRAEEKKKALQDSLNAENTELELQKLQLEYQQALARGDKDAATQAQIAIQQLNKQYQTQKALDRIEQNAKKEEEKQQAILDADAAYKDKLKDAVTGAGNRASDLSATIKTVTELGNELTRVAKLRVLSEAKGATEKDKADFNIAFSNVLQEIAKSAKTSPEVLQAYGQFLAKDDKGNYVKDAKGNYVPLSANEAKTVTFRRGGGTATIPKGGALTELDQLAAGMKTFASEIIGKQGYTLSDIYLALTKGTPKQSTISFKSDAEMKSVIAQNAGKNSAQYKNPYGDDGYLTNAARESIVFAKKLQAGSTFTDPNGQTYIVKNGYDAKFNPGYAVRKALGGYVQRAASGVSGMMSSQPYLVGERGPELFVPSSGGQIIPNNILGAKYNIPSNTISGIGGAANNSYNNNVYNIDIQLSGTNVTADDIMRKFKAELALINAKEGRVRNLGGNY
jgi:TP901 family phage tail tape measure protein